MRKTSNSITNNNPNTKSVTSTLHWAKFSIFAWLKINKSTNRWIVITNDEQNKEGGGKEKKLVDGQSETKGECYHSSTRVLRFFPRLISFSCDDTSGRSEQISEKRRPSNSERDLHSYQRPHLEDEIVLRFSVIFIGYFHRSARHGDRWTRSVLPAFSRRRNRLADETLPNVVPRSLAQRRHDRCLLWLARPLSIGKPDSLCAYSTHREEKKKEGKDIGQWTRKCVEPLSIRGKRNSSRTARRFDRCLILNRGWHTFTGTRTRLYVCKEKRKENP